MKTWAKLTSLLCTILFVVNQLSQEQYFLRRQLAVGATVDIQQNEQQFQITLTGVPHRLPTVMENMVFESVLFDYLKAELSSKGIRVYGVRVKADKSIHYRRSLDETFTVTGEKYSSNGDMEIDQDTLIRINDENRRVLESAAGANNESSTVHQLSLLVNVKGSYRSDPPIDYDTIVMTAINDGQTELVQKLVKTEGSVYFEDVQFLVCVGVGPRQSEPVLQIMSSENKHENSDSTTSSSTSDNEGQQRTSTSNTATSSSNNYISQGRTSINESQQESEALYQPTFNSIIQPPNYNTNNNLKNIKSNINSGIKATARSQDYGSKGKNRIDNLKSNVEEVFNAQAMQFRLVSGIVFVGLCLVVVILQLIRIATKKNEERKRRLILAKKAYEGPKKDFMKPNQSFYSNRKYTGTMDTGDGL